MRRVVITGIGVVTPLGNDIETTWKGLIEKRSGIDHIEKFNPSGLTSRIAGELKNFSSENYIVRKDIQRLDPFIHYAIAAAAMAAEDAGDWSGVGLNDVRPYSKCRNRYRLKQGWNNQHGKRPAKASFKRQTLLRISNACNNNQHGSILYLYEIRHKRTIYWHINSMCLRD
jgi:hypothetical protein